MNKKILSIDDEEDILELIRFNLTRDGYHVICSASGEDALNKVFLDSFDLVLLDLMLPGIDGLDVAKAIKNNAKTKEIPIIMLTAKGEEADIVTGLELGADDYITKPFSPRVLMARIKAVLRRKEREQVATGNSIKVHELEIDSAKHEVMVSGKRIELTFTEFEVLKYLAENPGWVFTRSQIVDAVRGDGYAVTDRSVDVQIVGLRKKLGETGKYNETVRGVGYRFMEKK
jgi:two-component system phosphate regulon response regulator PhoB